MQSLAYEQDNNIIYVTCLFNSTMDADPGPLLQPVVSAGFSDGFVSLFDTDGNYLRGLTMQGSKVDAGSAVIADNNGNAFIAGRFQSNTLTVGSFTLQNNETITYDAFLLKLDTSLVTNTGGLMNEFIAELFPNPFSDRINIGMHNMKGEKAIVIYDMEGRIIYDVRSENEVTHSVDLRKELPGIYILTVRSNYLLFTERICLIK